MSYFKKNGEEIILCNGESVPVEIEEEYRDIRNGYSVKYDVVDWADDDTDSGMGYCYDNSYSIYREPFRSEIVVENGKIWGFCFKKDYYDTICIALSDAGTTQTVFGHNSGRYGHSTRWTLVREDDPLAAKYAYVIIDEADRKKKFTSANFPKGIVGRCVKTVGIEDSRGHYDGRMRAWLELTDEASKDIDAAIDSLRSFKKISCAIPAKKY